MTPVTSVSFLVSGACCYANRPELSVKIFLMRLLRSHISVGQSLRIYRGPIRLSLKGRVRRWDNFEGAQQFFSRRLAILSCGDLTSNRLNRVEVFRFLVCYPNERSLCRPVRSHPRCRQLIVSCPKPKANGLISSYSQRRLTAPTNSKSLLFLCSLRIIPRILQL